jgi:hypothetical protein
VSVSTRYASVLLLIAGALSGCVSTKIVPVDHKALATFQGRTVATSQRDKPAFAANTAGKVMFGMVGAVVAVTSGNALIKENDVADPATAISQALLADLVTYDFLTPAQGASTTNTDDVQKLAQQYSNADLLLDVQTVNWSFWYFPTNWTHYKVIYSAKLRLIDTKHSKLLADGFCARVPEETPDAPTHDELVENNAARLKKELATAADFCIQEFRTKVFARS